MSLVPTARVQLDPALSNKDFFNAISKIEKTKGILSVKFNEKTHRAVINYRAGSNADAKVRKIKGVQTVNVYQGH